MSSQWVQLGSTLISLCIVKILVCDGKKPLNCIAIARVDCYANACRQTGFLQLLAEPLSDALRNLLGRSPFSLREYEGKFIAPIARRGINDARTDPEDIAQTAQCPTSRQMAVCVINIFQSVQIEKQQGKRPLGPSRPLDFSAQHVQKSTIVGKTGQRIRDREISRLLLGSLGFRDIQGDTQTADYHAVRITKRLQMFLVGMSFTAHLIAYRLPSKRFMMQGNRRELCFFSLGIFGKFAADNLTGIQMQIRQRFSRQVSHSEISIGGPKNGRHLFCDELQ